MESNEEKDKVVPIESNVLKMLQLEQYVYRVLNYTSRYNNSNSYYYAPINLVGKYVKYPSYGDFPEAYFLVLGSDSSNENFETSQQDSTLSKTQTSQPVADSQRFFQVIERAPKRLVEETPQTSPQTFVNNKVIKTEDNFHNEVEVKLEQLVDEAENLEATREADIFDNFGKYIASLLRALPQETALHLQQEVINLVLNAHIYSTVN